MMLDQVYFITSGLARIPGGRTISTYRRAAFFHRQGLARRVVFVEMEPDATLTSVVNAAAARDLISTDRPGDVSFVNPFFCAATGKSEYTYPGPGPNRLPEPDIVVTQTSRRTVFSKVYLLENRLFMREYYNDQRQRTLMEWIQAGVVVARQFFDGGRFGPVEWLDVASHSRLGFRNHVDFFTWWIDHYLDRVSPIVCDVRGNVETAVFAHATAGAKLYQVHNGIPAAKADYMFPENMDFSVKNSYGILTRIRESNNEQDRVILLTDEQRLDVERDVGPSGRIVTIPHPCVSPASVSDLGKEPGIRVVQVAVLDRRKRQDLAIEAFAIFSRQHPEARLEFYGQGGWLSDLERLAVDRGLGDRAVFQGYVDDVIDRVRGASFGLFTSVVEGFLLGMGEMLANGVPVVSTPVHYGARDQIVDGFNGFVTRSFQPDDIASAMEDALGLKTKPSDISREYTQRFSSEVIADLWRNVLD